MKFLPHSVNSAVSAAEKVQNIIHGKNIKIGNSGLPVEMPVEKIKDKMGIGCLLDEAFNYQMIKDKIQISANDMIRLHNIGKK